MKTAIVTEDFAGLTGGGGIGTRCRGLALLLQQLGHEVDIVLTGPDISPLTAAALPGAPAMRVTQLSTLYGRESYAAHDDIARSYYAYDHLKRRAYDVVHFNDRAGHGFYYTMARRQGLVGGFVVTHAHGSSEWTRRHDLGLPRIEDLEREGIERFQLENSDLVLSPSRHLLDEYAAGGLKLDRTAVCPPLLPQWIESGSAAGPLATRAVEPGSLRQVIFFGRQERRKGFETFVSALAGSAALADLDITFLGPFGTFEQEFTGGYALRRLRGHRGRLRFVDGLGQRAALDLIAETPDALCVMPAQAAGSPCAVAECFTLGAPFLASPAGGTADLIAPGSTAEALCPADPAALRQALERIARDGMPALLSTLDPAAIREGWRALDERLRADVAAARRAPPRDPETPLVTICLVHHDRPDFLRRALAAIARQDYPRIEIVLVDDGSSTPAAAAALDEIERQPGPFPVKVIRSANRYLGAARNLAAANASGAWLLFHDDDNVAEPSEISTFVRAAQASGCEVMTSQYLIFDDAAGPEGARLRFFPMGIGGPFSLFRNRFGDANCLVSRTAFERLGGFSELRGVGVEDWEFFLRAHLAGLRIGVVPEPLFRYRLSPGGMLASGSLVRDYDRILQAAARHATAFDRDVLGLAVRDQVAREVRERLHGLLERQPFSALHGRMADPDSTPDERREALFELLLALGRRRDAAEFGLGVPALAQQAAEVASALPRDGEAGPQVVMARQHLTPVAADAVYARGWLSDPAALGAGPFALKTAGAVYAGSAMARSAR
ncbi:glycosyltransferase, partial [Enterovirga sp.]|uniref:glycosyltransferase n=1 Tax=Enterovirga sp. TaxID=2026350 RepID=UPI00260A507B